MDTFDLHNLEGSRAKYQYFYYRDEDTVICPKSHVS